VIDAGEVGRLVSRIEQWIPPRRDRPWRSDALASMILVRASRRCRPGFYVAASTFTVFFTTAFTGSSRPLPILPATR
jgi:hypothetical protein